MSAYDLSSIFDVVPIKRTDLVGDTLSTIVAFLRGPSRAPDDPMSAEPDEDESTEIDWWQHYGIMSRPPDGSEALIARVGAQSFAIASRFLGATGFGKLNAGDVALYSVGKCAIRLNANGSISVIAPDLRGKQMIMRFDPKGEITMMLGNGFIAQLSEANGFVVNVPNKDITLAGRNVNIVAQALINAAPVFKANAAGAKPLAADSLNPGIFV